MKSIQPLLLIRKPGFHSTLDILEIEHSLECRVTAEEEGRKGGSVYSACHISLSSLKTIKREKGGSSRVSHKSLSFLSFPIQLSLKRDMSPSALSPSFPLFCLGYINICGG